MGILQRLQRERRGRKTEEGIFYFVGQPVLCVALNIAALTPVLILLFIVDISVSGNGLTE